MPDILHRISIDAPQQRVHDLIASTDGANLTSLKTGAEGGALAAYPAGEVSRWGWRTIHASAGPTPPTEEIR